MNYCLFEQNRIPRGGEKQLFVGSINSSSFDTQKGTAFPMEQKEEIFYQATNFFFHVQGTFMSSKYFVYIISRQNRCDAGIP